MSALNTDLYELTMAAGYFMAGKAGDVATFELSVRRLPANRNFLLAAGLAQAIEYLTELRFSEDEIDYLRSLKQFARLPNFSSICAISASRGMSSPFLKERPYSPASPF
jgi:nicotinate phosphoribosyltransferase